MDELNFESIQNTEVNDISTLDGMTPEKLDLLSTLGVMVQPDVVVKDEDTEVQNTLSDESEKKIEIKIDTNVDAPNIILQRSELIKALKYATIMIKKTTNDIEASSLNITLKDNGTALYRLKDNMSYVTIEGKCDVSNNNPITKTLSFNVSYLVKLLSATAEDILIYEGTSIDQKNEEVKVYYIRLINGDYILDVFEGNEAKLVPTGNKSNNLYTIPSNAASTLCDVMIPLISDTQEVSAKRTILYSDRAIFKSQTYLLQFKNVFSNMCFSKKELELIKIMSTAGNIEIYQTDAVNENRIIMQAGNVTVSTSVSIPNQDALLLSRLSILENAKYIRVDKDDFKRVLFLSGLGTNNVGRLYMNYNIEGEGLDAKIEGRTGNSTLLIKGENYNNLEPKSEPFVIYAPQLSILLKAFESGKDLEVAFLDEGVAFRDKSIGIDAIMNYAH